jgi:hypothetical protein
VKLLLLSLFTQIEYQLPNMVMGILLRENIRQAVQVGISANQILQVRLPACGGISFSTMPSAHRVCVCVVCCTLRVARRVLRSFSRRTRIHR